MKIYTRTGDDGTTSLFSGGRVPKHHLRVESYGTVDELNSVIGVVRAAQPSASTDAYLARIQHQLFNLGADLATPLDAPTDYVVRMDAETVTWLEQAIDHMMDNLPRLSYFILPGGSPAAAHIHVARTVCRRAERLAPEDRVHQFILGVVGQRLSLGGQRRQEGGEGQREAGEDHLDVLHDSVSGKGFDA